MTLPGFEYKAPTTVAKAVSLLEEYGEDATLIAGGTNLVVTLGYRLVRPKVLVSLANIPELCGIRTDGEHRIGAMATHREIERSLAVRQGAPLLSKACGRVGSSAIRNMGTIGGNITFGDAASDPVPALLALDARATLTGPRGKRIVPLDGFFKDLFETDLRTGEILTAVHVPRTPEASRSTFVKYTCLSEAAVAVVSVATLVVPGPDRTCADVRIGLGGVGRTALRATAAEAVLRGRTATQARIAEAAEAAVSIIDPPTDGQGTAQYRREMTRLWVRRSLEELAGL